MYFSYSSAALEPSVIRKFGGRLRFILFSSSYFGINGNLTLLFRSQVIYFYLSLWSDYFYLNSSSPLVHVGDYIKSNTS